MLADLFLQTLHVARFLGTDHFGQESYGTPEPHACRYQPSTRLLRDKDGGQSVSEAVLFTLAEVSVDDLIYPPGADPTDEAQGRKPLRVDRHHDLMSGQLAYVTVHI